MIAGLVELEAAKSLLLASLAAGVAEGEVLSGLRRLESFRNSLWRADQVLIQAAQRFGLAERHAVSSIEKLLVQVLRISPGDARARVRAAAVVGPRTSMLGESLPAVRPVLAAAQAGGVVGPVAVDLIERTLATVEVCAPGQVADTEAVLVGHATVFGPGELGRICDRVTAHVDPDGTRPRDAVVRDRRALFLGRCRDGMVRVEGRLTPAAGARIKAVLGPLAAPRPTVEPGPQGGERVVPDVRSSEQRMHDAWDEACARLLRAGDVPASGGTPATVIITMTADQVRGATGSPGGSSAANPTSKPKDRTAGCSAGTAPAGPGVGGLVDTSTGEVVSVPEALRLAGEADLVSVVLSHSGRPLQLGRTRRCATTSQTYPLIARDGGCSFPGCSMPPEWCERHHLIPWAAGGTTDVDNLTLLCGYHHAHFAAQGWTCTLDPDGLPAWRPPRWQQRDRPPLINHRIRQRIQERIQERLQTRNGHSDPLRC